MIRGALWLIVWLCIGAAIALVFSHDNGYVLIRFGHYVLETSLVFFTFALIAVLVLVYAAVWLLRATWLLPRRVRGGSLRRREERAHRALLRGLLRLWEGHWREAERELVRRAGDAVAPIAYFLPAARAAQQQGALDRRDRYLEQAFQSEPGSELAALLSQTRLQMEEGELEKAISSVERAAVLAPDEPLVLALAVNLYRDSDQWERIAELLPRMQKRSSIPGLSWEDLALETHERLLARATESGLDPLREAWDGVPKTLRTNPRLLQCYCAGLTRHAEQQEAAELITGYLRREWDPGLALLFSRVRADDPVRQLATAEEWLKHYGERPELLLMAGRLCRRNRLWGRARNYLNASLRSRPRAEIYFELGCLLQEINETQAAQEAFRGGLQLAIDDSKAVPQSGAVVAS